MRWSATPLILLSFLAFTGAFGCQTASADQNLPSLSTEPGLRLRLWAAKEEEAPPR